MYVIAMAGRIGTGKSTVCRFLQELGVTVLNVDVIGHESYQKGTAGYGELVKAFGEDIIGPDGEIDRKKLGGIVFQDPEARQKLNSIVWPRMREIAEAKLRELKNAGVKVAALEAAVLIEAGWQNLTDELWVTVALQETVIERLGKRDGLSREQITARISAQASPALYAEHADVVIDTDRSMEELLQIITVLLAQRIASNSKGFQQKNPTG